MRSRQEPQMQFASIEGSKPVRSAPRAFVSAFARRIAAGLFPGAPAKRTRYAVTREGGDVLQFRAVNWWTAFNVGLNEVELAVSPDRQVRYRVRYPRWAAYALAGSGAFGLVFIAFLLLFDIRDYIARHAASRFPGLSLDQNVAIAWAMALFWGFAWPWILIAMHKGPLRRLMERLIDEVDAEAAGEARRG
jgi:hypothetical protein